MQKPNMLVLEEGACPFAMGPGYACCYAALMFYR